jgi:selenocysteine lyase/cysteine desulfurase
LAATLRRELATVDGVRLLDRGRTQCAIVTVEIPGRDATQIVAELARRGVNTTASLRWYGLIDFTEKGTQCAVRLSPHYYNTEKEVDAVVGHIRELVSR